MAEDHALRRCFRSCIRTCPGACGESIHTFGIDGTYKLDGKSLTVNAGKATTVDIQTLTDDKLVLGKQGEKNTFEFGKKK